MNKNKEKQLNFFKLIPNMLSLLALCFGITSIKLAYSGHFSMAVSFILLACFLDGIDGRVARFLNVSSDFGVQIDSLADLVNFGIAPGFIVYYWKMNEMGVDMLSWSVVLMLGCCMAIRLARFNVATKIEDKESPLVKYFFTGMPAPAVACMVILPIILSFQFGYGFFSNPIFVVLNTLIIALFAASTIPTPCFKKIKIGDKYKHLVLIVASLWLILLVLEPWLALSILGLLYVISIIIGIFMFMHFKKNQNKKWYVK
ncbi:MAG: phosphatidylcholine/phosphatidylserine synthase [Rickettsiales bacterium]|nr:phosphatidylcholine/phosphatidylserine synthase [Rickettsiales bacterium]